MAHSKFDRPDSITDEGGAWKYFAPMLHMDDDDLDPYEYRLLGHYRRVCGENGGKCTESTRTTAEKTKMSTGKISGARKHLEALGRIKIVYTKKTCEITLRDCWAENIARYVKRSPGEHVHTVNSPSHEHVHHMNTPREIGRSPGEPKNKLKKEQPNTSIEPKIVEISPRPIDPMFEAIAKVWKTRAGAIVGYIRCMMLGTARKGDWKDANFDTAATPDEIIKFGAWWSKHHPDLSIPRKPEKIQSYFYEFRAARERYNAAHPTTAVAPAPVINDVPSDADEYRAWLAAQMEKTA